MTNTRVRLRFSKQQDLRQIGHRDLLRTLERLLRRAGLSLAMSQGFHPKPKLSFPLALAVGIAGKEEVMELELAEEMPAEQVLAALAAQCPPGLEFHSAEVLPPGTKSGAVVSVAYEFPLPASRVDSLRLRIAEALAAQALVVRREDRDLSLDIRPMIDDVSLEATPTGDAVLRFALRTSPGEVGARPREVLQALGADDLEAEGRFLTRTAVELRT